MWPTIRAMPMPASGLRPVPWYWPPCQAGSAMIALRAIAFQATPCG